MDSDDNCLVIDESIADMEVSSTSETPAPKDVCEIGNHNENEAEVARTLLPSAQSTMVLNSSTKKSSTRRNSDGHVNEKHKEKEKDRHREKRRSKDERRKTVAASSSEKNRSLSRKTNCIRLTEAMFKEKLLNITVPKHQLYSMRFSYRKGYLTAEVPTVYPAPPVFPDLNLTQLLNWPDIRIIINLEHLKFSREIKQNCKRDLVFGDDILMGIDARKNPIETRHIQKAPTTKPKPMVSKTVFDAYVTTLMDAAPQYKLGPTKLPEIERAFRQMLNDIGGIPFRSIQTRIPHSRFLNQHKYFSISKPSNSKHSGGHPFEVRFRECINAEVIFEIEKCGFLSDCVDQWQDKVFRYLKEILVKHNQGTLTDRFKKCLVLKCEKCNETFEGALLSVTLANHIKQKHFVEKQWTCVKCLRKWDQFELLNMEWKHDCQTGA